MTTKIQIKSNDKKVQKYEILGKLIQENAEGLAALEKEKPAEKAREDKSLKSTSEGEK